MPKYKSFEDAESNHNAIVRFKDKYSFLSNFYPSPVMFHKTLFSSAEHAYVFAKSLYTDEVIRKGLLPYIYNPYVSCSSVKKIGRRLSIDVEEWDKNKVSHMKSIVRSKFFRNPYLREELLATGDAVLIEGNTWGDTVWGMIETRKGLSGQNNLGKLLMSTRERLKLEVLRRSK